MYITNGRVFGGILIFGYFLKTWAYLSKLLTGHLQVTRRTIKLWFNEEKLFHLILTTYQNYLLALTFHVYIANYFHVLLIRCNLPAFCGSACLKMHTLHSCIPSTGVARIFPTEGGGGAKRGSEAIERGRVSEGISPSHAREIFENLCMKTNSNFLAH